MGCVAMMVAYLIFEDGSERDKHPGNELRAQTPIYLGDTSLLNKKQWEQPGKSTEKKTSTEAFLEHK